MPVQAAFVLWLQELQNRYLVIPEKKLEKNNFSVLSSALPKLNEPDLIFFCTIDEQQCCINSLREIRSLNPREAEILL